MRCSVLWLHGAYVFGKQEKWPHTHRYASFSRSCSSHAHRDLNLVSLNLSFSLFLAQALSLPRTDTNSRHTLVPLCSSAIFVASCNRPRLELLLFALSLNLAEG